MTPMWRSTLAIVIFVPLGLLSGWMVRDLPVLPKSVIAFVGLMVLLPLYSLFLNWPKWRAITRLPPVMLRSAVQSTNSQSASKNLFLGGVALVAIAFSVAFGIYFGWKLAFGIGAVCWWFGMDRLEDGVSAQLTAWRLNRAEKDVEDDVTEIQARLDNAAGTMVEGEQNRIKVGAASKALQSLVMREVVAGRKLDPNSMWVSLGSLAGYACQASIRAVLRSKGVDEEAAFIEVKDKDGRRFFVGDTLNAPLAESEASVWRFICTGAQECGVPDMPELGDFFEHCIQTIGSPDFGKVRVGDDGSEPLWTVPESVSAMWPRAEVILHRMLEDPREWPIAFGMAIKWTMVEWKGRLNMREAVSILMDSAVAASKIDFQRA